MKVVTDSELHIANSGYSPQVFTKSLILLFTTPNHYCKMCLPGNWKRQLKREPLRQPKREPVGNRKGNHLMQNTLLVG